MNKRWLIAGSLLLTALAITIGGLVSNWNREREARIQQTFFDLLAADAAVGLAALDAVAETDDPRFLGPLIDLYWASQINLLSWPDPAEILETLNQIADEEAGEEVGNEWADWVAWYSRSDIEPPENYRQWKGALLGELTADFEAFFIEPVAEGFRLEEVVWGGVAKDGIPALDYLEQIPILEGDYTPRDAIFGVSISGDSRAYPLRVMDWHEMANDFIGDTPVAIAYCTLCGSAIAFKSELPDGTVLDFGSSGLLYRSNKLMYDRQTNTLWNQLTGEPVMGPLVGQVDHLERLPIVISTVGEWAERHPDATILPLETGHFRDYTAGAAYGEYFYSDDLRFPAALIDDRLPAKAQVFSVIVDDIPKAYPVDRLSQQPLINDLIGTQPLVLINFSRDINVYGYSYELEYITYRAGVETRAYERGDESFIELNLETNELVSATGEAWQIEEERLIGPNGEELKRVSGSIVYWFGWQSFYQNSELYEN
ncbi:MAG: DUF3179 domain-containing protein [Chloroflexota bacterium]